ncbi:MAG TPA: ABC transporter substrate-binding protein [Streptosporangiaceae bacterium]|jgi:peptide/nickel transport system substrate-binding protein
MKHPLMKSLVIVGAISLGLTAACSTSSSSPSAKSGPTQGKPLVVVDATGLTFTKNFNPYVNTSLGNSNNSTALVYEPLLMFNIMQPTQAPIPWLATSYAWSGGGKTLTFTIRKGVKFSDGKPLTAADVAFSFNLLKNNPSLTLSAPPPVPVSATAPNATTAVLTFSQPEYANLFLIGGMYIVPQHIWQSISNPATFADPDPVGTGPYVVSQFSAQKYTLTQNKFYWQKSKLHVPSIIFPNFVSNTTANPALSDGQIDYAGNDVSNVQSNFLAKSTDYHTWTTDKPWFSDNNVVTLWLNTTRAPLNDAKVRLAISAGIDRQQLSTQGETDYEPPATSSGGLLLPIDSALVDQSVSNDLSATADASKVSQILSSDGWKKVGGKWTKGGKEIKFAIEDPSAFTDYATDAQLIATQLNNEGFDVSFSGVEATKWFADYPVGNFDAMIHWSNQGPNPYYYFQNWIDNTQSAPVGKPAAGDYGRFNDPAAQAALAEFAGSNSSATQQDALNKLQQIVATQAPVIPLLYGAAWYEYSTKNYTGWPTASNQYNNPVPNDPYILATVLHLKPVG